MSLSTLRTRIDEINAQLITLLGERLSIALEIARVKKQENLPLFDPDRERSIHEKIGELARSQKLSAPIIEEMFQLLLEYTKIEMDREMQS